MKEFDILYLLYSNPDVTFSKEQIYQAVWHEFSNDYFHAVENTIYQIRKKITSIFAIHGLYKNGCRIWLQISAE